MEWEELKLVSLAKGNDNEAIELLLKRNILRDTRGDFIRISRNDTGGSTWR